LKLVIVAVGSRMPEWVKAACNEYIRRMPRQLGVEIVEVKPEKRGAGRSPEQILALESVRLESAIPPNATRIALDESGENWSSAQLAQTVRETMGRKAPLAFLIGGADGLAAGIKLRAHRLLSLSNMTLPHALARVVLCEQLYRAASIINAHPYHRE
jgi:23S rRNA (pseudouridine1915-N3)-methyltransferase